MRASYKPVRHSAAGQPVVGARGFAMRLHAAMGTPIALSVTMP